MFTTAALRTVLKSSAGVLREFCSTAAATPWARSTVLSTAPRVSCGQFAVPPPVRHYARSSKAKTPAPPPGQLSDIPLTMLKTDYSAVPLAQTTDDLVKRLLSLEFGSNADKMRVKKEELIAKVQRDKNDRNSVEVRVAIMTTQIRNWQEHLLKHPKDKSNKRLMLMTIDKRKKLLKNFRMVRYDDFNSLCEKLGITYTFPPEYYRRTSRRSLAKKELCKKVYQEVIKRKARKRAWRKEQRLLEATMAAGSKSEIKS